MKQIAILVRFDIAQKVYRKCDVETKPYYVVSYCVDLKDVLYKISGIDGDFYCYFFEIDDYNNRLADYN